MSPLAFGPPTPHLCHCDGQWIGGLQMRGYVQPFGTYRCKCRCHPDDTQSAS